MKSRRAILLLIVFGAGCAPRDGHPASDAETSLQNGVRYLWSRQQRDGGWHSNTYGLLRSGQSLTPFILDALLGAGAGARPHPPEQVDRAVKFLLNSIDGAGAMGRGDPLVADYPNYATSLGIRALARAQRIRPRPGAAEAIRRAAAWLSSQQLTEQNGWQPDHPAYGAWGIGGDRRTPPEPGHVDLSMTRHVLQALAAAGVPAGDAVFSRAAIFLGRCQNPDGGFIFSTVVLDANKAGKEGSRLRSYGTATADGILALLAAGASREDARVAAAAKWLASRHQGILAPGFPGPMYQRWAEGLKLYYAAAGAEAFRALEAAPGPGVPQHLVKTQRRDGSWANAESLVKEDDPLIATGLAVKALASSLTAVY